MNQQHQNYIDFLLTSEFNTASALIQQVPVEVLVVNKYDPIKEEGAERH